MIGVVVNTAALGSISGDIYSSGRVKHRERIALVEDLLSRLSKDEWVDEIVVAGEWRDPLPNERWKYAPAPSINFDCTDALRQRQIGAEETTADTLVFLHDDHFPDPDFFAILNLMRRAGPPWDVLVPRRACEREGVAVILNNGSPHYVMGHCCVMRRAMWEVAPWTKVPRVFAWDVGHTFLLQEHHARIRFPDNLIVRDMETMLGATPWT